MNARVFGWILLGGVLLFGCQNNDVEQVEKPDNSLNRIAESGTLVVGTEYNSINYYVYKGRPWGYQYELLNEFAQHLNVKLELHISQNLSEKIDNLKKGDLDILALGLTVTKDRKQHIEFTVPA